MTNLVAAVIVDDASPRFIPCLHALRRALPSSRIVVASAVDDIALAGVAATIGAELALEHDAAALVRTFRDRVDGTVRAGDAFPTHVLLVTAPVLVPDDLVERSLEFLDQDLRVATVSFLSNNAGYLSVPVRNTPTYHLLGQHDQNSITHRLRNTEPDDGFASVPLPAGSVHLISRHALSACNGLRIDLPLSANGLISEFALRAQRRGFVCAVDSGTFVLSPSDVGATGADPIDDGAERPVLLREHPFVAATERAAKHDDDSPAALVVTCATSKFTGLRVIIDGRCLGDMEMGTQVHTLAVAKGLADRDDVRIVTVATNGPIPRYADCVFALPKVRHEIVNGADFSTVTPSDILHRPYQPDVMLPINEWRRSVGRVLITLQDLIAYQVGAYASDGHAWDAYRRAVRSGVEQADGVVVISNDTKAQCGFERLAISQERIFVVPCGTDHLTGDESDRMPGELLRRGFGTVRFLVVIGANYSHKNRDLAIDAWQLVRETHSDVALVLVGASVPFGSSRVAESAAAAQADPGLYVLPDVTSVERNWLLRHAEAVVYPTSAEGFGLVPFESASFGTPTVHVEFGPLEELNPLVEGSAASWSAGEFAAAIRSMLDDPALRSRYVAATVESGARYTWSATAAALVAAYRLILSRPPNRVDVTSL